MCESGLCYSKRPAPGSSEPETKAIRGWKEVALRWMRKQLYYVPLYLASSGQSMSEIAVQRENSDATAADGSHCRELTGSKWHELCRVQPRHCGTTTQHNRCVLARKGPTCICDAIEPISQISRAPSTAS